MRSLWIDTTDYVGPCRRTGQGGFRLLNRRRLAIQGKPPALATLIRQLRMTDLGYANDAERRTFRLRLSAAANLAEAVGEETCRQYLLRAISAFDRASDARTIARLAADLLSQAASQLA